MNAVETVRAWHQALNGGDAEGLLALSADDVEVGGPRGGGRGASLLREWFARADVRLAPRRIYARGSSVVVEQEATWTAAAEAPQTVASVFTTRDERVASVVRYPDLAAALAAAQLGEADAV